MRRQPDSIPLSKAQKAESVALIKDYLLENFDIEAGRLQAEALVNFISERIGKYYYNKGIEDASAFLSERVEDLFLLLKEDGSRAGSW